MHLVTANIRLDDLPEGSPRRIPAIVEGNRSLIYRFASSDMESTESIDAGAGVVAVLEPDTDEYCRVQLLFWANVVNFWAAPGATFDIWYGGIVGHGQILDIEPRS